jgi:catechol 2,3-dioxygenase-like lactoylglutathione lyase family enzyme
MTASAFAQLDHVLLVVSEAQPTLSFLTGVVGLRVAPRPPFRFPGWWLYAGERAAVHMALRDNGEALGEQVGAQRGPGGGVVDHVAFSIPDAQAIRQRLIDGNWSFHEAVVPETGERQFFIAIPQGPVVELVTATS